MFRYLVFTGLLFHVFITHAQVVTHSVVGNVTDKSTGLPLTGVLIELHEAGRRCLSDSTGNFRFTGVRPGGHHLHAQAIGYAAIAMEILVSDSSETIMIVLVPTQIELGQILIESSVSLTDYLHQSVDLITARKDELDKMRGMTLSQTLSLIPGINAVQTGVGISKPVIRGLSGNRIMVADLGMKQEGQQWGNDHGLEIDQFAPEHIEIIKGPASLLFGSDAMGGVIHILPPSVPAVGLRGNVLMTGRTNNDFVGTSVMLEGNKSGKFFRLRSTLNEYGDYKVPAEEFTYLNRTLPIAGNKLRNTAGKELHFTGTGGVTGERGTMKITLSNFHQESGMFPGIIGIPNGASVADDGDSRNIGLPRLYLNHFKAAMNASWIRLKGWLQIDGGYQENVRKEEVKPHSEGYAPLPGDSIAHLLRLRTSQVSLRWHGPNIGNVKIIPGISALVQKNSRDGFEFLLPSFQYWTTGAYVFAEYNPQKGHKVLNGGIRVDYGHFNSDAFKSFLWNSDQQITGYIQRSVQTERTFVNISGAIGYSWFPTDVFNLKINFGKSFRMPNAAELSVNGVHHGTYRHEQGDGSLNPENGYQIDAVGMWRKENWLLKISPYFNYFEGYIYLRPQADFSELPDGGQLYRYTQNDAIYTGGELYAEYHPMRALHLESGLEYVYSYNLQSALALPFTPPLQIRLSAEYSKEKERGAMAKWFFGARGRGIARQEFTDRNEKVTQGYYLFDAYMGLDFRVKDQIIQMRISLNNSLDRRYMNHLSLYRQLNLPEQGRNLSFSLSIPFQF